MFTGIIECTGRIASVKKIDNSRRIEVSIGKDLSGVQIGDSVAISGSCLTVISKNQSSLLFDVSSETLSKTILSMLSTGNRVNIEFAMVANSRFGGHIVTGHVDEVGRIISLRKDGEYLKISVEVSSKYQQLLVPKGSITINGVSLTVNSVKGRVFDVMIIPHTLEITTLSDIDDKINNLVNIEFDIIGKYISKMIAPYLKKDDQTS